MRESLWICTGALAAALACSPLLKGPTSTPAPAPSPAVSMGGLTKIAPKPGVPRTADGKADLQGFWDGATLTPLERPRAAADKTVLTAEEAKRIAQTAAERTERASLPSDPNRTAPPVGGDGSTGPAGNVGGYNAFWIDRGSDVTSINGEARAAIIVDPPDGRVPPLAPEAAERMTARRGRAVRANSDAPESELQTRRGAYDDIELRPLGERCLMGFGSTSGPPALPVMYNNIKQIVQTPDHVLILNEMVHDARIVRLNGTHLPKTIRRWMGDSIGHWEGDTLVVETTNFSDKTRFRGSSPDMKVTERLTRMDDKTLLYQFTVEDPTTWQRPWSGEYTWKWSAEPLYEYACHEGNYSFEDIMKGARLREAEEAKAQAALAKPAPAAKPAAAAKRVAPAARPKKSAKPAAPRIQKSK